MIVATDEDEPAPQRMSTLMKYTTAIFVSLLTIAVVLIVSLLCYHRRRMKTMAGATVILRLR